MLADTDEGGRPGVTWGQHAEIKRLKAEKIRLREDVDILRARSRPHAPATAVDHHRDGRDQWDRDDIGDQFDVGCAIVDGGDHHQDEQDCERHVRALAG